MSLPKAIYKKPKSRPIDIVFKGYSKNAVLTQGELSDCLNLSTDNFPTLSPRPSRENANTLGTANALFTANEVLCWVDGTSFKYNGVSKGSVTSGTKSMVEFNNNILIFPDKKKYDYVADSFSDIGTGTYPTAGSCPDMDIVVTHDNRVYGVKDNIIYWSARGNANDWTTFDATEEEAGSITISKVREFTGVVEYQQHIVFFTENETLEMYGSPPSLSIRDSFK